MALRRGLLPACARIGDGAPRPDGGPAGRGAERDAGTPHAVRARRSSGLTSGSYVHPLSQIVLERLQSRHGLWVADTGLDAGLRFKEDGTFVLRFPSADDGVFVDGAGPGDVEVEGRNAEERMTEHGAIWTVYEAAEKKHYLCVSKGRLVGQYLLQDNSKSAWHTEKRSTPERIRDAVDGMVEQIQDFGIGGGSK